MGKKQKLAGVSGKTDKTKKITLTQRIADLEESTIPIFFDGNIYKLSDGLVAVYEIASDIKRVYGSRLDMHREELNEINIKHRNLLSAIQAYNELPWYKRIFSKI